MNLSFFQVVVILIFSLCCSCAFNTKRNPIIKALPSGEYSQLLGKSTRKANQYVGFHQTFQADVSRLDTELATAQLRQKADFYEWDQKRYLGEREKTLQENAAYAKYFIRFYSAERDYDDLSNPNTIWKIYLEYAGSRFEGKVRKLNDKLVELQALYPQFDRFSSPYEVTFKVPMSTIEQGESKVVLTSSLGTAEFQFPPIK